MNRPVIIGVIALFLVVLVGLYVTDFVAYLGNNPSNCNNCHVMDGVYEGWYRGGHQLWTTCNDCHTPHALLPKYWVKARSGYHHVTAFVFGPIPENIRAIESSREIVQENCIRCHAEIVSAMYESPMPQERYCFDCHRSVPHGERGISLLPYQHKESD